MVHNTKNIHCTESGKKSDARDATNREPHNSMHRQKALTKLPMANCMVLGWVSKGEVTFPAYFTARKLVRTATIKERMVWQEFGGSCSCNK
ncbi:hypothetical protein PVL29_010018 [Vitis rotundifolia]|uniref:Uncharacterized protein n=1 Tax=Vitis rotundifolia TaxID=103349 RepID=A0AA38ZS54_VITRO|nr:hypothetical protein PVL29_010018 [Vitis rotundifolia]